MKRLSLGLARQYEATQKRVESLSTPQLVVLAGIAAVEWYERSKRFLEDLDAWRADIAGWDDTDIRLFSGIARMVLPALAHDEESRELFDELICILEAERESRGL